jgi:hypothetical protein
VLAKTYKFRATVDARHAIEALLGDAVVTDCALREMP